MAQHSQPSPHPRPSTVLRNQHASRQLRDKQIQQASNAVLRALQRLLRRLLERRSDAKLDAPTRTIEGVLGAPDAVLVAQTRRDLHLEQQALADRVPAVLVCLPRAALVPAAQRPLDGRRAAQADEQVLVAAQLAGGDLRLSPGGGLRSRRVVRRVQVRHLVREAFDLLGEGREVRGVRRVEADRAEGFARGRRVGGWRRSVVSCVVEVREEAWWEDVLNGQEPV